jgi:hypothetical protein
MPTSLARFLALLRLCLVAGILCGCAQHPPAKVVYIPSPENINWASVQKWLKLQVSVADLPVEQINAGLVGMNRPTAADQLFYYGLLHQHSQTYDGWITARDVFRELSQNSAISVEQQELATILEKFNQNRINWHERYGQLQQQCDDLSQQLTETQQQAQVLEQKIQAITDLEATISTRKEE